MKRTRFGVLLAVALPWFAANAAAVHGRVFERAGGFGIAGLMMKLVGTDKVYVSTTQQDGSYHFEGVSDGTYELQILQGLRLIEEVPLQVSGDAARDFALDQPR